MPTLLQLRKLHILATREADRATRIANDPTGYTPDRLAAAREALDYGRATLAVSQMIQRAVVVGSA